MLLSDAEKSSLWLQAARENLERRRKEGLLQEDQLDILNWMASEPLPQTVDVVSMLGERTGLLFYVDIQDRELVSSIVYPITDCEDMVVEAIVMKRQATELENEMYDLRDQAENLAETATHDAYKQVP